jgi:hypothetical protein
MIGPYHAAYAALWHIQSGTPALHEARKHLLSVIGGQGSDEQREAIAWAVRTFGEPMNLDPHTTKQFWDEAS